MESVLRGRGPASLARGYARRDAGALPPQPSAVLQGKLAAKKSIYSLLCRLVPAPGPQLAADETGRSAG